MGKFRKPTPDPDYNPITREKKGRRRSLDSVIDPIPTKKVKKRMKEEDFPLLSNVLRPFKWGEPVHQILELIGEEHAQSYEHSLQNLYESELSIYCQIDSFTDRFRDLIKAAQASRPRGEKS